MTKNILTIAGSDPTGGAGVQRDLQTIARLGHHGMSVITALTAQNSTGVQGIEPVSPDFVRAQLYSVLDDMDVHAVKIGMVGSAENIAVLAEELPMNVPIILDPVLRASGGGELLDEEGMRVLKEKLLPRVSVLTPNIPEAEKLTRKAVLDMEVGARAVQSLGVANVVLKGGHFGGARSADLLLDEGGEAHMFDAPRLDIAEIRGTGCALSSALACYLAEGQNLIEAVAAAKNYVRDALLLA